VKVLKLKKIQKIKKSPYPKRKGKALSQILTTTAISLVRRY